MDTAVGATTKSTSSSAAVADGASAAADSKTTVAAVAAAANSIKLLIKASNMQHEDQIIESDLLWTVKRLKSQLSLVYPSKPPVSEQKLIYSGQLLNDNLLLKDVIRKYKDVYTQNHIIHLVYTPKYVPVKKTQTDKDKVTTSARASAARSGIANNMSTATATANGSSADGLRHRQVTAATATVEQQQQQTTQQQQINWAMQQQMIAQFANMPQYAAGACPPYGQFNMQQAAMYSWMQQIYSQYMEQYLRLSDPTTAPPAQNYVPPFNPYMQLPFAAAANVNAAATATPNFNPVIPFPANAAGTAMPQWPYATPLTTALAHEVAQTNVNAAATAANAPDAAAAAPAEAVVQQQPQAEEQPARRFPNIVQDEDANRDWLDNFFSMTRLAIFLTVLYLNSSPIRCLFVVLIAGSIYLYHIGVLRIRNERNNNNINRNNNANANEADQIRQGVQQVQEAQAAEQQQNAEQNEVLVAGEAAPLIAAQQENAADGNNINSSSSNDNNGAAAENAEENRSSSVISFIRTFVVTFFTSLLPETPAAL